VTPGVVSKSREPFREAESPWDAMNQGIQRIVFKDNGYSITLEADAHGGITWTGDVLLKKP